MPLLAILPLDATENCRDPFTPPQNKSPKYPLGALTPNPVPAVFQLVEVVPAGSIRKYGLVVVEVPPVNQVPVSCTPGADAAPLTLLVQRVVSVMLPPPSTLLPVTAPSALELERNCSSEPVPAGEAPLIATLPAAVSLPLESTVNVGT